MPRTISGELTDLIARLHAPRHARRQRPAGRRNRCRRRNATVPPVTGSCGCRVMSRPLKSGGVDGQALPVVADAAPGLVPLVIGAGAECTSFRGKHDDPLVLVAGCLVESVAQFGCDDLVDSIEPLGEIEPDLAHMRLGLRVDNSRVAHFSSSPFSKSPASRRTAWPRSARRRREMLRHTRRRNGAGPVYRESVSETSGSARSVDFERIPPVYLRRSEC